MNEVYESPFTSRYASREMSGLFSEQHRAVLFRKIWLALAEAQKKLGLPITDHQIAQMRSHLEQIPFDKVRDYEKRFRHDVMAHIHAFGDQCPDAKPILHLGATSTLVTDNADLIQMREALELLFKKLIVAIHSLRTLADKTKSSPCLCYTHYQAAQPATVGRRVCLWLQDLLDDALEWDRLLSTLPFLGAKGATGTQSSFLTLFDGNDAKAKELDTLLAHSFGFKTVIPISGQTYSRKLDLKVLHSLASFSAGVHKMATDLRLLAHDGEMREAFGESQVGSSAMPYKRNPIYAERLCGISRFVISLSQNPAYTLATQWLERSLDDSANRRLTLPEAFLGADAILNILIPLIQNLKVETAVSLRRLEEEIPHLAMENILMESVKRGGDRQKLHETLRRLSDDRHLIDRIAANPDFHLKADEIRACFAIPGLIGRSTEQVEEFLSQSIDPFLKKHKETAVEIPPLEI